MILAAKGDAPVPEAKAEGKNEQEAKVQGYQVDQSCLQG